MTPNDGDDDDDYVIVDSIPLLCSSCDLPLTLSMDSIALITGAAGTSIAVPSQSLLHGASSGEHSDPSRITHGAFKEALDHFRLILETQEYEQITRTATFADVVTALVACKNAQQSNSTAKKRGLQHLDRLLQRIHHYKGVVDIAVQNSSQLVSLVWASMVFLIQVTSSFATLQGRMARMLSEIADSVGRVELFKTLYPTQHMLCTVASLYAEIVEVLRSMVDFWKRNRIDKRILNAFWNPFEIKYQEAAERIKYLVEHVDKTAAASHMLVTKTQNEDLILAVQGIQARLDEQHKCLLILQAETFVAKSYSQKLRRYLLSTRAQKEEDDFLRRQLARQTYGTCEFITATKQYQQWAVSSSSMLLGLVGGPGSGKSIISAFLYDRARMYASDGSPVIWIHCYPVTRSSLVRLLRAMIWKILEQRPDILLKHLHDKKHYLRLFRGANTFQQLWRIFTEIVSCLDELWIIVDSIHDVEDGAASFISSLCILIRQLGSRCRIKVTLSSRSLSDVAATDVVLRYTAEDMRNGIREYARQKIWRAGWGDPSGEKITELVRVADETIVGLGGGLFWAEAVVTVAKAQASEEAARKTISRLKTPEAITEYLWRRFYENSQLPRALLLAVAEVLIPPTTTSPSPMAVMDIYNALTSEWPDVMEGVDITTVTAIVQTRLEGLANRVGKEYGISNEIRRHLRPHLEAAWSSEHEVSDELGDEDEIGPQEAISHSVVNAKFKGEYCYSCWMALVSLLSILGAYILYGGVGGAGDAGL